MRSRSYSYSPPPRGYSRRGRIPSPKGRYGRGRDPPTSLLVRNLRLDCRPEDLHGPFGRFGPLRDIYLPRDYYTGEPRGFGFVQYVDPADAADAKYHMDGQVLLGRELTVVFAEESRKKPWEMRQKEQTRRSGRRYSASYSHSPQYAHAYSRSPDYYSPSPRKRHYSKSISPRERRYRERSYSRSPYYSRRGRSYSRSPYYSRRDRSYSRSPYYSRRDRSYSGSPYYSRRHSRSRSFSRSRSRSLEYSR